MKLLWIGTEANKPAEAAFALPLQKVPSLVALAMAEKPQYDAVLLDCREELAYSLPHILAAHAALQTTEYLLRGCHSTGTPRWAENARCCSRGHTGAAAEAAVGH